MKKKKIYVIFDANKQPLVYCAFIATAFIATSELMEFNNCWLISNSVFGEDKGAKAICFQKRKTAKFILSLLSEKRVEMTDEQKAVIKNGGMNPEPPATPCFIKSYWVTPGVRQCWKI